MLTKEPLYFPGVLLTSNILIAFISYLISSYFELIPSEENPRFSRNHSILQLSITSSLMLIVLYQLVLHFFPSEFNFFPDDSKEENFQTFKNLEKKNADQQLITICVFLGYFVEKIFIFSFEFLNSSNNPPAKSLIRSCEIGPCFNLIAANIINSLAFPIILFIISGLIFAGYGILGYFGVSLIALGALSNIVTISSLSFLGNLGANAHKLSILTKFNEFGKEKVFNATWYPQNYRAFLRAAGFLTVILAGVSSAGNFVCFLNKFNLIILKSLQIFGLGVGFAMPHLLNGLLINGTQIITNYIVIFFKFS